MKSPSSEHLFSIENNPVKRENKAKQAEKRQIQAKNRVYSKLKENEKPINATFKRKKNDFEHHSPKSNKKITDFFALQPANRKKSTKKSKKTLNNSVNFREIAEEVSQKSQRASSSFGSRKEIKAENLKLKEEVRKLNRIMVEKDTIIQENQQKAQTLRKKIESTRQDYEISLSSQKVFTKFMRKNMIFAYFS